MMAWGEGYSPFGNGGQRGLPAVEGPKGSRTQETNHALDAGELKDKRAPRSVHRESKRGPIDRPRALASMVA